MESFLGTLQRRITLSYSDDGTGGLECERLSGGIVGLVWFVLLEKVRHSLRNPLYNLFQLVDR